MRQVQEDPGVLYRRELPHLEAALTHHHRGLTSLCRGVADTYVVGRVKSSRSLIRKLRDGDRTWESITDKVGLRIICTTRADVRTIDARIQSGPWDVVAREVKRGKGTRSLFYPGTHFEISSDACVDHSGSAIVCEVQLRTRAQDAWAVASHKLTYKGPIKLPKRMRRSIDRLTVLVELFDEEISRAFKKRAELPMYGPAILSEYLDGKYEDLSDEIADAAQDLSMLRTLLSAYSQSDVGTITNIVDDYVGTNPELPTLIRDHTVASPTYDDRADWLFTQPEVLLVLERATSKPYQLLAAIQDTDLETIVRRTCITAGLQLPELG